VTLKEGENLIQPERWQQELEQLLQAVFGCVLRLTRLSSMA
jgi:hypothetical protein